MLLIITNSLDETVNFLCDKLKHEHVKYIRFDSDHKHGDVFVTYSKGNLILTYKGVEIDSTLINNVWYRRPKNINYGIGADQFEHEHISGEWAETFENFFNQIPREKWINYPINNFLASRKLDQLKVAKSFGLNVPKTLITQENTELISFFKECNGRIVVKPLRSGFIDRGDDEKSSLIYTNRVSEEKLSDTSLINCPTFFQEEIIKTSDYRVSIIDNHITAIRLDRLSEDNTQILDIRRDNMSKVNYTKVLLPSYISDKLLDVLKYYKLRFAAIDLASDSDGNYYFFEINPNGQWAWMDIVGISEIYKDFINVFSDRR